MFLLAFLGCVAVLYSLISVFYEVRVNGVHAQATVVSAQSRQIAGVRGGTSYTGTTDVAFVAVDGKTRVHTFHDEFLGAKPGEQISVIYNPSKPEDVIADTWSDLFFFGVTVFAMFALFMAFIAI
ncbi:hypothetical protein CLA18_06225 [Pseudomonas protegens]|nr:DUF3592 domain-containing protein [Pseudomonas protegens]QEN46109.1 hypothetical protein CLA18_06225 [Pseudomonas protegens]